MKVAVSGASGFIGRYVLSNLISLGIRPVAITRKKAKLQEFNEKIETIELDLAIPHEKIYEKIGSPDVLIHLAWDGLPNYKSLHHIETELPNQYRLLKALFRDGLKKAFVAGTCFEYGMQSGELPASLETKPGNPYGFAKDTLRKQLTFLNSELDFQLVWGRIFYMYGEGQSPNSLYPQLKSAVETGEKSFNMSGGDQVRDYLHIAQVAKMIVDLSIKDHHLGCVNICSGKPITVKELVKKWLTENQWNIELNLGHYPYPDYEPMMFWGQKQEVNWNE